MTTPKLCCPYCQQFESRVVDSRPSETNGAIWRRRQCCHCRKKFTTTERVVGIYQKRSSTTTHHNM